MSSRLTSLRILYLESPYSYLFRDLNSLISPEWSHTLIFSFGYLLYKPTKNYTFVKSAISRITPNANSLRLVASLPSIVNCNVRKANPSEIQEMAAFYEYLKDFVRENQVDLVICHNDLRWQHAIAKNVCHEMGVKVLFFEEGYFRPDTITVDHSGVNSYSSLPKSAEFYRNANTKAKTLKSFANATSLQRILRLVHFNIFMVLDTLGVLFSINTETRNKEYSFKKYFGLFINKLMVQTTPKAPSTALPDRYIFVALQVSEDTQTVIHSPFAGTQDFIDTVEQAFYQMPKIARDHVKLVFKKHPMEGPKPYRFNTESVVLTADTNYLIQNSIGVVLINSSTIAQCLRLNKPVITLGNSFFDISGLTYKTDRTKLEAALIALLSNEIALDKSLYEKFLIYLKNQYQYNMNLYYYDKIDLKSFLDELASKEFNDLQLRHLP